MGDKTGIQWTDSTWNPIVGCSVVSPGCTNCYAMKMAARIEKMAGTEYREELGKSICPSHYADLTRPSKSGPVWTGKIARAPDNTFTAPLRWKRPRRIFVNSMGDLFHEDIPDEWVDRVFAVMALAPQHTFQCLTKRSARMRAYMSADRRHAIFNAAVDQAEPHQPFAYDWPLTNCWLGVSAEDQRRADERVPDLLATPAAVRFVSAEPLLSEINFRRICIGAPSPFESPANLEIKAVQFTVDALVGAKSLGWRGLDQIIVGGESGPNARPMHVTWARSIVAQCGSARIGCFVKQLGADPVWEDGVLLNLRDHKGGDMAEWPEDLRVRELPGSSP